MCSVAINPTAARRRTYAGCCNICGASSDSQSKKHGENSHKNWRIQYSRIFSPASLSCRIVQFNKTKVTQDDRCADVLYLQSGNAKVTAVNAQGTEAVVAIMGPDDSLGEAGILDNPLRLATATAIGALKAVAIEKLEMIRVLRDEQRFAYKFIQYMLKRNIKIESDLVN